MYKSAAWIAGYKSIFYKLGAAEEDPELKSALKGNTQAPVSGQPTKTKKYIDSMKKPSKYRAQPIVALLGSRG